MSWLSAALKGIGGALTGGHNPTPTPQKFSGLQMAQGSTPPQLNQQAIINSVRTDPDLAGIWQTIQGLGGDVWGALTSLLPKGADGSIDWGKVGGDVVGFLKNNAGEILRTGLDVAGAVSQAQRQGKSDDYAKQALQLAQKTYDTNALLRDQGRAGMLNPGANTPDLSAIRTLATSGSGNPFTKTIPMASIATQPGQSAEMPSSQSAFSMAPLDPVSHSSVPVGVAASQPASGGAGPRTIPMAPPTQRRPEPLIPTQRKLLMPPLAGS